MGTRVAPTYANLFMGVLEQKILDNCPPHFHQHLHLWNRFIDDMLILLTDSWYSFQDFFNYINNFHRTMKFDEPCYDPLSNSCNFGPSGVRVLPLAAGINEGGHYWSERVACASGAN